MSKLIANYLILTCLLICCKTVCHAHSENSLLLLISFDGFRWDYIDMVKRKGHHTPNFDFLLNTGARANWIKNTFVTVTLPNHYTIVTGMYEESHGVVDNSFYDPVFNETFSGGTQKADPKWWNNGTKLGGGEPVWITNEKFEKRSGVHGWPGPEGLYHGEIPYKQVLFNSDIKFETRIDTVAKWFSQEMHLINFGALYFEEPDHTGHVYGPDSEEIVNKIIELDNLTGYLINKLKLFNLIDRINIIITSDHGMANIDKYIYIDDYVDPALYKQFGGETLWNILPEEGKEEVVFEKLKTVPDVDVYRKKDIPGVYHYTHNRRIQPIIVSPHQGVMLFHNRNKTSTTAGNHGYNNSLASMHPLFLAHGPAFRKGAVVDHFNNIDIYPLMCHILDIEPAANNGSLENVKDLLRREEFFTLTVLTFLLSVGLAATLSGVYCVAACRARAIYMRRHIVFKIQMNNNDSIDAMVEGKTPLLNSDSEEIV